MLIVSRKQNQRVMFPNLGIAVQILRVAGKTVRVGIDAPDDVRILRGELADAEDGPPQVKSARHHLRNRLNAAQLALHLLQKQLDHGKLSDAEETLRQAMESFTELDQLVAGNQADRPSDGEGRRRALVVEDNGNERELLAGYLKLCGFDVDTVEDGMAALSHLASNDLPDFILLDMQMPRMNGVETVSAIRRNSRYERIKVFAVSGADRTEMQTQVRGRGVDKWFAKPLQPAEFAAQLDQEMACAVA